MPRPKRLVDRIAGAAVLLPAGLGVLCLVGDVAERGTVTSGGASVLVISAGITCALHVWFRAEDRWRRRRLLGEARRRRLRVQEAIQLP